MGCKARLIKVCWGEVGSVDIFSIFTQLERSGSRWVLFREQPFGLRPAFVVQEREIIFVNVSGGELNRSSHVSHVMAGGCTVVLNRKKSGYVPVQCSNWIGLSKHIQLNKLQRSIAGVGALTSRFAKRHVEHGMFLF